MTKGIPITAEIVKMSQLRSRATACDVRQETARQIAEEAVLALDPELDLLIEPESAYSRDDRLLSTFEINDIVVNGARLDVRVLQDDGRVSIPRYLVGTSYMNVGSLVVAFHQDRTASIAGFVPRSDWDLQEKHAGPQEDKLIFRVSGAFDLAAKLPSIVSSAAPPQKAGRLNLQASDIPQFCGHRQEMKLSKQREVLETVLNNESTWVELQSGISRTFVRKTLNHATVWNKKIDVLSETLQPKFQRLKKDEVKAVLAKLGEQLGGQPESTQFRKEMLLNLSREELSRSLKGEQLKKASKVIEQVLSGRGVLDVLKETVKSSTAIDLALTIKRQRQKVAHFIEASSDEISSAFRQMALQPVYATHSKAPEDGVESVNEALNLLDAGELAEALKALEAELS